MFRLYFAILAAAALVACGSDQEQSAQPLPEVKAEVEAAASLDPAKGIDWFEGSVEEAFAAAK